MEEGKGKGKARERATGPMDYAKVAVAVCTLAAGGTMELAAEATTGTQFENGGRSSGGRTQRTGRRGARSRGAVGRGAGRRGTARRQAGKSMGEAADGSRTQTLRIPMCSGRRRRRRLGSSEERSRSKTICLEHPLSYGSTRNVCAVSMGGRNALAAIP